MTIDELLKSLDVAGEALASLSPLFRAGLAVYLLEVLDSPLDQEDSKRFLQDCKDAISNRQARGRW